jgi:hypothetical protein
MLAMFGHFVSDILGFGNVHTSVAAALTLRMFHVKHSQGFQAKRHLCIFIWKPQGVGHEVSQHKPTSQLNWDVFSYINIEGFYED